MLANVFTKSTRDRWIGLAVATGAVGLWLLMAMAIYRDIDLGIYTDLPSGFRDLMNIPEGADVGTLAYGVMFGFVAAIMLASFALSMGAASIAGEERDGTIGLLLGNPKSRTQVLISKAAAMVLLIGLATLGLWGGAVLVPMVLDVSIAGTHLGAMLFHMFVNALLWGFLAMMIGGLTGSRSTASGTTVGFMVLSYFAVGLLPLVESLAGLSKFFPWHYLDSSDPLSNGINWAHISVMFGLSAIFAVVAWVSVNRRDLRGKSTKVTMVDRLREHPMTKKIVDRVAGSARVSRIWIKTLSEHQGLLFIAGYSMVVMGAMLGPMFVAIDETLIEFAENLPDALMAMTGGADIATAEGWYQTEVFSLMGPVVVILVTAVIGARALAGEEAKRTMGLLLANPIKRSTIVLEKTVTMIIAGIAAGFLTGAGVVLGNFISGLGMSISAILATTTLMTLLGLVFGALALALSAATGRVKISVYGTAGAAFSFFVVNSYFPLSDSLASYAKITPFHYFLSSDPLVNGMNWLHAGVLAALVVVLVGAAVVLFNRRDIRQIG